MFKELDFIKETTTYFPEIEGSSIIIGPFLEKE